MENLYKIKKASEEKAREEQIDEAFQTYRKRTFGLLRAILGSIFLGVFSQFAIHLPFTPIPISLQTLGLFVLLLSFRKQAFSSVFVYLLQATIGLPVLAGGLRNPLWFWSPTAGYLFGFLLAAYLAGLGKEKKRNLFNASSSLLLAQGVIFSFGLLWLSFFVSWQKLYSLGIAPFLSGFFLKSLLALGIVLPTEKLFSLLQGFCKKTPKK